MLDPTGLEDNGPVRIVTAERGRDQESAWEFGIDNDFIACIQLLHEVSFDIGIDDRVVVDMFLELSRRSGEMLAALAS